MSVILVAEMEAKTRRMLRRFLEGCKLEVQAAANLQEAQGLLAAARIDALVVGLGALALTSLRGQRLGERRTVCYAVCILAAICTTVGNTLINWLDSVIFGYYTPALIFGGLVWRFIVGMINAVVMASLAMPLVKILRKQNAVSGL